MKPGTIAIIAKSESHYRPFTGTSNSIMMKIAKLGQKVQRLKLQLMNYQYVEMTRLIMMYLKVSRIKFHLATMSDHDLFLQMLKCQM